MPWVEDMFFLGLNSVNVLSPCDGGKPAAWKHLGPAGYATEALSVPSSGAAQAAVHLNGTAWLIGTANGGIWHTNNILGAPEPAWTQQLDDSPVTCSSISAMSTAISGTILAGCGAATSSEMGSTWDVANSGDWGGVMISRDNGMSWSMVKSNPFANFYISSLVVISQSTFLVGARSSLYNQHSASTGGVWRSTDGGETWAKVFSKPVFDLRYRAPHLLVAVPWAPDAESLYLSSDGGTTAASFLPWSTGLSWAGAAARKAFYPNLALGDGVVFVGALTVNPVNLSDTSSAIFVRDLSELDPTASSPTGWRVVANSPRLDQDAMPKDRMALLVNPDDEDMLFVAGNAGALSWRVDWKAGEWTSTAYADTSDRSAPHPDCRNYYWELITSSLIVLNDGGGHMRSNPTKPGGKWTSLSGNTGAMEFISAAYEPTTNSWVAGAQDNCVQFSFNASTAKRSNGFIFGDGAATAVDSSVSPPRFYGCTQFLGQVADADAPHRRRISVEADDRDDDENRDDEDDEDDRASFGYLTYDPASGKSSYTGIPLLDHFDLNQFPFFDQPFALNTASPKSVNGLPVVVWVRAGKGKPAGFYVVQPEDKDASPMLEATTDGDVYLFVAGGMTDGKTDMSVLVAMNDTHLMTRNANTNGSLVVAKMPTAFSPPVIFAFTSPDTSVVGPVSHKRTVSLAVDPNDSSVVAVSGWTSLVDNKGKEVIHLTLDSGKTWLDITGDLTNSTGVCANRDVCGKWRPSALLMLPIASKTPVVLVGTVSGVFATVVKKGENVTWMRLGGCTELPLVLAAGLSYDAASDTVVVATMGRGVYILPTATALVRRALSL